MTKYIVSSVIDPNPYRATSAVPAVGVIGTLNLDESPPPGKLAISFFAGDLDYGTEGTKEAPEADDFMTLYIPAENLTRVEEP